MKLIVLIALFGLVLAESRRFNGIETDLMINDTVMYPIQSKGYQIRLTSQSRFSAILFHNNETFNACYNMTTCMFVSDQAPLNSDPLSYVLKISALNPTSVNLVWNNNKENDPIAVAVITLFFACLALFIVWISGFLANSRICV